MGAPGEHEGVDLVGKPRRQHGRHPAALAQADQVHPATQIVDRHHHFFEVVVDLQVFHVGRGRFPVGQRDVADPVGQQGFDQALALVVVGDRQPCGRHEVHRPAVGMPWPGVP